MVEVEKMMMMLLTLLAPRSFLLAVAEKLV